MVHSGFDVPNAVFTIDCCLYGACRPSFRFTCSGRPRRAENKLHRDLRVRVDHDARRTSSTTASYSARIGVIYWSHPIIPLLSQSAHNILVPIYAPAPNSLLFRPAFQYTAFCYMHPPTHGGWRLPGLKALVRMNFAFPPTQYLI